MRANPISGYLHYVASVTKTCKGCCATGHDVSQGTLKGDISRGTPFQYTANIIEKIYPKRLSELKARSNSPGPLFMPSCLRVPENIMYRKPSFREEFFSEPRRTEGSNLPHNFSPW